MNRPSKNSVYFFAKLLKGANKLSKNIPKGANKLSKNIPKGANKLSKNISKGANKQLKNALKCAQRIKIRKNFKKIPTVLASKLS